MVPIARGNLMVPIFRKKYSRPKFLRKLLPAFLEKEISATYWFQKRRQFIGSSFSEKIQQGATTRVFGLTRSEYF